MNRKLSSLDEDRRQRGRLGTFTSTLLLHSRQQRNSRTSTGRRRHIQPSMPSLLATLRVAIWIEFTDPAVKD